jgi:hypothetical protein
MSGRTEYTPFRKPAVKRSKGRTVRNGIKSGPKTENDEQCQLELLDSDASMVECLARHWLQEHGTQPAGAKAAAEQALMEIRRKADLHPTSRPPHSSPLKCKPSLIPITNLSNRPVVIFVPGVMIAFLTGFALAPKIPFPAITFGAIKALIEHLNIIVVELTGLIVIVTYSIRHIIDLWRRTH